MYLFEFFYEVTKGFLKKKKKTNDLAWLVENKIKHKKWKWEFVLVVH